MARKETLHVNVKNNKQLNAIRTKFNEFVMSDPESLFSKSFLSKKTLRDSVDLFKEQHPLPPGDFNILPLFKLPMRLPFSGTISDFRLASDGEITLKPDNFSIDGLEEIIQDEFDLIHQIQQNRNNEDVEYDEWSGNQFLLFFSSIKLTHILSRHMVSGNFQNPSVGTFTRRDKTASFSINRHYLQLLLALESMDLKTISERLTVICAEILEGLTEFSTYIEMVLEPTPRTKAFIAHTEEIKLSFSAVASELKRISEGANIMTGSFVEPFVELFTHLNTSTGKELTWNLREEKDWLKLGDISESLIDTDINKEMEYVVKNLIKEYFIFEQSHDGQKHAETLNVDSSSHPFKPATFFLREKRMGHLEPLQLLKESFDHYAATIEKRTPEFNNSHEYLKKGIEFLEEDTNVVLEKDIVLHNYESLRHVYNRAFEEVHADMRFKAEIKEWSQKLSNKKGQLTILDLFSKKISEKPELLTDVHAAIKPSLSQLEEAVKRYHDTLSQLNTTKKSPSGLAVPGKIKDLTNSKKSLADVYEKEIKTLQESSTQDDILNVIKNIKRSISDFHHEVSQASFETNSESSSEPKTIMIGLGQAGQQIVGAAVAKLLNSTSDTRSKNMLNGLGIKIEKIKELTKDSKTLDKVADHEKEKEYFDAFNKANLLAINAGPELKDLLGKPYNYIWGRTNDPEIIRENTKDWIRPATNLVLLDPGSRGSGNKTGKGRVYAVRAQAGLETAMRQKIGAQNITQVCIVHSFAGGSGSGMILPFLSIVKSLLPEAVVWVFSAGVEFNSPDPFKNHNTTYITSDILQAHYDALHHREEKMLYKDWERIKTQVLDYGLKALNSDFETISEWMKIEDVPLEEAYKAVNAVLDKVSIGTGLNKLAETGDQHDILRDSLPKDIGTATKLQEFASNPTNRGAVRNWWSAWHSSAYDKGCRAIANKLDIRLKEEESEKMTTRFPVTMSMFDAIRSGMSKTVASGGAERAKSDISSEDIPENFKSLMLYGVELAEQDIDQAEARGKLVEQYGKKMRNYHHQISELGQRILLMVGAREDTKVKHVVISNSHLDKAAAFYKGKESPYEIYNSVMIDVFVNLIHGLIQDTDYSDIKALQASATSYESMDASDLRSATHPPIHATMIDLPNTQDIANTHAYVPEIDTSNLDVDPVYALFGFLYSRGSSPLYVETINGTVQNSGSVEPMKAFYQNYLSNPDGLRSVNPSQAMKLNDDDADRVHFLKKEGFETFLDGQKEDKEFMIELKKAQKPPYNFGKVEFLNMINWLALFPVNLIASCFEDATKHFIQNSDNVLQFQKELNDEDSKVSMFHKENKTNSLTNHVGLCLPNTKADHRKYMVKLLLGIGVINVQHLAAIPSGILYEFAPNILQNLQRETHVNIDNNPTPLKDLLKYDILSPDPVPSRNLMRAGKYWKGHEDYKEYFKKEQEFDASELRYLRVPVLPENPQEGSAMVPYIEIDSSFMKDLATLKIETGYKHPEFSNLTLLDKLVTSASNVSLSEIMRDSSETPILRHSRKDLEIYSLPKKLFPDEAEVVRFIRLLLLGTSPSKATKSVRLQYEHLRSDLFVETNMWEHYESVMNPMDFSQGFSVSNMSSILEERYKKLVELNPEDLACKDATNGAILAKFLKNLHLESQNSDESKDSEEPKELNSEEILRHLNEAYDIKTGVSDNFDIDGFDKTLHDSIHLQLHNMLERLLSIWNDAIRQHEFLSGVAKAGQGVSFNFEGTVDSVRSTPSNYLALVNTSASLSPRMIKGSIHHYYKAYMDDATSASSPKGKVYIQRLASGPVANITLLQQKAAIVEIAESFAGLMDLLKNKRMSVISAPLVHPYSFLRNILWMSTMSLRWTENAKEQYLDMLDIPNEVVEQIFSKPDLIQELVKTVMVHDDMTGFQFSLADSNLWDSVHMVGEKIDDTNRQRRFRSPIHIPDMLLIKALMYGREEPTVLADCIEENKEILKIYPKENWIDRLEHSGLTSMAFRQVRREEAKPNLKPLPFALKSPKKPENGISDTNLGENVWLSALKKWMDWIETPKPAVDDE